LPDGIQVVNGRSRRKKRKRGAGRNLHPVGVELHEKPVQAAIPFRVSRLRRLCGPPKRTACPSWGYGTSQRIRVSAVGAYRLAPPSSSLDPKARTSRSSRRDRQPKSQTRRLIRSQASAPLQGRTERPCHRPKPIAPLMGSAPLRRMCSRGVRSTRACLTRHLPASGFLTLLPAYSSSGRVGLFHPTNALGVSPSKAFPLRPGWPAHANPFPSCRYRSPQAAPGRLQGLPPVRRSVRTRRRFKPTDSRCPPGLCRAPARPFIRNGELPKDNARPRRNG